MRVLSMLCNVVLVLSTKTPSPQFPVIDLEYNLQQPTSYDRQHDIYIFKDIRYAAPPTGSNRFNSPQAPSPNRSAVQTGGQQAICAQASPTGQLVTTSGLPTTEDCLFLDVYVPRSVLHEARTRRDVPVVVWIHGGGYVQSSKDIDPRGWFERDGEQDGSGLIFVAINYRLGAFGWLAGSDFLSHGGVANAGLHDQRFALQWVQDHIGKFGGDPSSVTVIGESAGGGSIMHHITAYGGHAPCHFQKAIMQSPAFQPQTDDDRLDTQLATFLDLLNVTTLAEAREASFDAVSQANAVQISHSQLFQNTFGPAVDGTLVPHLPSDLLSAGHFDKNVAVMLGYNAHEDATPSPPPSVVAQTNFRDYLTTFLPSSATTPSDMEYISQTLYPPIYDGTQNYTDAFTRTAKVVAEVSIECNTFYVDAAFDGQGYAYVFAVPPATHGQDVDFTFHVGKANDSQSRIAVEMQKYFVNFAEVGNPNGRDLEAWETFGDGAVKMFNVTGHGSMSVDRGLEERCRWWQDHL